MEDTGSSKVPEKYKYYIYCSKQNDLFLIISTSYHMVDVLY